MQFSFKFITVKCIENTDFNNSFETRGNLLQLPVIIFVLKDLLRKVYEI